jgi:hypothetical protein
MHRHDDGRGPRADLRLSDADREDALARLSEHYAAGRIDKDEFDERSDAVWTARTGADLAPVFADLGPVRPDRAGAPFRGPWGRRGWMPLPFLPVLFVLIALTVLTHIPFVLLAFVGCFLVLGRRRRYAWRTWR